jgi:peroxiredoxin Q/BCP
MLPSRPRVLRWRSRNKMRALVALVALGCSCTPASSAPPMSGTAPSSPASSASAPVLTTPRSADVPSSLTTPRSADVPPSSLTTPRSADVPSGGNDTTGDALVGNLAPDFTATAHDGTVFHLAALRGKPVVLYFYPKDETPGCTKEACSFRDALQKLAKTGAVIVGVSADTRESHQAFALHYSLPFLLLSDPDGAIGRLYGVPFAVRHRRQTFVIGADGTVHNVYRNVDVTVHAAQVLEDLRHARPAE